MTHAIECLIQAADAIESRASQRDTPEGERSMARAVATFNAVHGTALSEADGWRFMIALKLARATAGAFHADDYVDLAAYAALASESEAPA